MALTTIGENTTKQLQPDWIYSEGPNGATATLNYKSSLAIIEAAKPAAKGATWTESDITGLPSDMVVDSWEVKRVAGGEAILTVNLVKDRREEISWIDSIQELRRHPGVLAVMSAEEIAKVDAAVNESNDARRATLYTALTTYGKTLYNLFYKGTSKWKQSLPVITITTRSYPTSLAKLTVSSGNELSSPACEYLTVPTTDFRSRTLYYVRFPDVATIENGNAVVKSTWWGYADVEDWIYSASSNMPGT
jgi:hypothetical protein